MRGLITLMVGIGFIAFQPITTFATPNPDTGPGCGLGKKLWEDWKGQKQIAPQVFMASTNVTGSYWFAISSGTSGCTNDTRIWDSERARLFIEINYTSLAEDMARGGGEHLASLATLLHVPQEHHPEFFAIVQERYSLVMDQGALSPASVAGALHGVIATHPALANPPNVPSFLPTP